MDKLISELTENQKSHLAWRIDHVTGHGYITACAIARGDFGDMLVSDVFRKAGKSDRSAKIHAHKVCTYGFISVPGFSFRKKK